MWPTVQGLYRVDTNQRSDASLPGNVSGFVTVTVIASPGWSLRGNAFWPLVRLLVAGKGILSKARQQTANQLALLGRYPVTVS